MPNPAEQVEGGGSKVAMFKGKVAGRWHQFIDAEHERYARESGGYEIGDFISVSAFLSDEAVERLAKKRIYLRMPLPFDERFSERDEEVEASAAMREARRLARADLQAAIGHLGGTDGH